VSNIKKISARNYRKFVDIIANAYPGFGVNSEDQKRKTTIRLLKVQRENPEISTWGYYKGHKLLGGLRLFDFTMTMYESKIPIGGGGLLAVDLLHKKEKVARELVEHFIQFYLKKGTCITALYPFRPDFYRKMGWGYGAKYNEYTIEPGHLPNGKSKEHITYLDKKDWKAVTDCYNRYADKTHGMFRKCKYEFGYIGKPEVRMVGYRDGRRILGYVAFEFKQLGKDNFIRNNIRIREFIYENRDAFNELITFMHTQFDQINAIHFPSIDDTLHFLPFDPRDGSNKIIGNLNHRTNTQGMGVMYRVIDTPGIFRQMKNHDFNGQTCKLKLTIKDSFLKSNDGSYIIHFNDGQAELKSGKDFEVEIILDVSDFSSMLMGVVKFEDLHLYGRAEITDMRYLPTVNRIFKAERKPDCTTWF